MATDNCVLAKRTDVRASYSKGVLTIRAKGKKPNALYIVQIKVAPESIEVPIYQILCCPPQGSVPAANLTDYDVEEGFFVTNAPPNIAVEHADGRDEVTVETIPFKPTGGDPA